MTHRSLEALLQSVGSPVTLLRHSQTGPYIYPVVPLWVNHGIGVALFSYDGALDWGIMADWDTMPDIERFTMHLRSALDELHAASQ